MPAKSEAQRRLMAAAANGADFPKAQQLREAMTDRQLKDFSQSTSHSDSETYRYNWRSRNNLKRGR